MSLTPAELGKRLRDARRQALLSQDEVGRRVEVARGTIARWEAGSRDISFSTLQSLTVALGTTVSALLGTPPPTAPTQASVTPTRDQLQTLERQSIEQIATALAERPEQLPILLALLFDGRPSSDERPTGVLDVLDRLAHVDINQLTPVAALTLLADLKRQMAESALPSSLSTS
jgi:transcriptional regulator with XRE-family HTH domain